MKSLTEKITVSINHFNDPCLPENARYVASITDGPYKGRIFGVSGANIADCFKEIYKSMECLDKFDEENNQD